MEYDRPLYTQIARELGAEILSGRITPGQKLPSVRQLAERLHVDPNTAQRAVATLKEFGFVQCKQGFGTFVVSDPIRITQARRKLASHYVGELRTQLETLGFSMAEMLDLISCTDKRNDK